MSRKRIFIYVQHLLGIGHLKRAATLASALCDAGCEVTLASGGYPVPGLVPRSARLVQLPAAGTADLDFKLLLDENGVPVDDSWREREAHLRAFLEEVLVDSDVGWHVRYLAGRPDRALTHLARAVDASAIVVGTHTPRASSRWHDVMDGSVAARLSHHQHRPVLVVPLRVVDWHARTPWQ